MFLYVWKNTNVNACSSLGDNYAIKIGPIFAKFILIDNFLFENVEIYSITNVDTNNMLWTERIHSQREHLPPPRTPHAESTRCC